MDLVAEVEDMISQASTSEWDAGSQNGFSGSRAHALDAGQSKMDRIFNSSGLGCDQLGYCEKWLGGQGLQ